jgi:hypothetical protein
MEVGRLPYILKIWIRAAALLVVILAGAWEGSPALAQQGGAKPADNPSAGLGTPGVPIDEIIQKFAVREAEFKVERDNYTYTQTFIIQTLDDTGRPDGEYRKKTEVVLLRKVSGMNTIFMLQPRHWSGLCCPSRIWTTWRIFNRSF